MSMTSCISHPDRERLVIIRKWQVEFCDGNQCAAALMSFFEYWHSWKLDTDNHNRKSNDIAEMHGDNRLLSEDIYQFHSLGEISDGILSLYGEKSISKAIKLLEEKSVISIHVNPNPRFHYDKRQYFRFYPDICNEWIKTSYKSRLRKSAPSIEQKGVVDDAKLPDAHGIISTLSGKNAVLKTEINNKEEINKLHNGFNQFEKLNGQTKASSESVKQVINYLLQLGMPDQYFVNEKEHQLIEDMLDLGATSTLFAEAYSIAQKATSTKGKTFGLRYLAKVVESLLNKTKKTDGDVSDKREHQGVASEPQSSKQKKYIYKHNLKNAASWAGDLI